MNINDSNLFGSGVSSGWVSMMEVSGESCKWTSIDDNQNRPLEFDSFRSKMRIQLNISWLKCRALITNIINTDRYKNVIEPESWCEVFVCTASESWRGSELRACMRTNVHGLHRARILLYPSMFMLLLGILWDYLHVGLQVRKVHQRRFKDKTGMFWLIQKDSKISQS